MCTIPALEFIFPTEHIDLRHWQALYHRKEEEKKAHDGDLYVACLQLFHSISLNQQFESVAAAPALASKYRMLFGSIQIEMVCIEKRFMSAVCRCRAHSPYRLTQR